MGLLAVVVYLYTVVAFNFFRKFYNKSDDEDARDMKCNDMLTVSSEKHPYKHMCQSILDITLFIAFQHKQTHTGSFSASADKQRRILKDRTAS